MPEHESDDELDDENSGPPEIKYYHHLKKHPKIIQYTLEKQYLKSKKDEIKKAQTARMISDLRNQ